MVWWIRKYLHLCLKVLSLIIQKKINIAPSPPGTPPAKIILLNNTEKLIFMFESPISNNEEKRNFAPPPARHWQKLIFWIYLIDMKIVIFMFERPISNNKENINVAPSPPLICMIYSVKQLDGNSFWGDVVLDSFNMAYRDENSILDIYILKQICWDF